VSRNYVAEDGYTRKFYVAPEPGIYESIRGTFRPATKAARTRLTERVEKLSVEDADKATAEEVAPRILSWSEEDGHGKPLPITPDTVLGLQPELLRVLSGIVMGYVPTDLDPEWPAAEQDAYRAQIREHKLAVEARELSDAKN
jgi:hypothetical protein